MTATEVLAEIEHVHTTVDEAVVAALAELSNPIAAETANVPLKDGGKFTYTYADLPSILQLVRPVLARHGLAVLQHVETGAGDSLCVTTVLRHSSGGSVSSGTLAVRMPPNPQQTGSTITYLRRYQLVALLGISAADDDDGRAASAVTQTKRKTTKRAETPPTPTTKRVAEITDMQRRHIMAMFNSLGLSGDEHRAARLAYTSSAIGREIETTNDITRDEARTLIEQLIADTQRSDEYAETGDYS